ncbi:MAG: hypothetical protein P9M03_01325 [Candidatus Theseobacter exili]|nr:hypothetical protein [Candidatus Theseobacter exili]
MFELEDHVLATWNYSMLRDYKGYTLKSRDKIFKFRVFDEAFESKQGYIVYVLREEVLINNKLTKKHTGQKGVFQSEFGEPWVVDFHDYNSQIKEMLRVAEERKLETFNCAYPRDFIDYTAPYDLNPDYYREPPPRITECIDAGKDAILGRINLIYLNSEEITESGFLNPIDATDSHDLHLLALHFFYKHNGQFNKFFRENAFSIGDLHDRCSLHYGHNGIGKYEYFCFLKEIGFLVNVWKEGSVIFNKQEKHGNKENVFSVEDYLHSWNKLEANIKESMRDGCPLAYLCHSVLDGSIAYLEREKVLQRCSYCDKIINYKPRKKYCSIVSEGRNCGKRARNTKYYQMNKDDIRPKARKATADLRAYYKSFGVKK